MENNTLYWVGFILIGGIIGWFTGTRAQGRGFGIAGDVALGIGGAILGGWLFGIFGLFRQGTLTAFSLVALVGAVALVSITHFVRRVA